MAQEGQERRRRHQAGKEQAILSDAASIRPFDAARDEPRLPGLFRAFEAKAYQQRVQGLDPERLAQFLTRGVVRSAAAQPTWIAVSGDQLIGLAALQNKHWHSEHTGFPVGKVTQLMTAPDAEAAFDKLLDQLESSAREHHLKHLACRTDGRAFAAQEILTRRGWYPVGTSVKFVAKLDSRHASRVTGHDLNLRPYLPEDRPRVLAIGTEGHEENHLYFDPHLPTDAAHAIFHRWVEKCLDGLAAQVWVAERGGEVIGFTTILNPKSFNEALGTRIAVLDYIVLDRAVQGQGLGSKHLLAVHNKLAADFDQVELRTTATNYAAVNLYAKHGYRLVGTDQAFGRWL